MLKAGAAVAGIGLFVMWRPAVAAVGRRKENRVKSDEVLLRAVMVLGAIGGLSGYLADAGVLQLLPPKWASTIGIVCGVCGAIAAFFHPAPAKVGSPVSGGAQSTEGR